MGRLFWKICLAFWLALVAAAAGTGTAVWLQRPTQEGFERERTFTPPHILATEMAASTLRHGGIEALRQWMTDASRIRPVLFFVVDDAGVDLLGREVPEQALAQAKEITSVSSTSRGAHLARSPSGERYLIFMPHTGQFPPRPPRPGPGPSLWLLIFICALASLAVSAVLAWYLTRPIRSMRSAFDAAARGRLDIRVSPLMGRRRDEIADLGRYFDRMAEQLQSLLLSQKRLLHDVSHELRSPLARLQAAVGLLRQDPGKLEASLERIERESARLDEMVGAVLTLARIEDGSLKTGTETIDIGDLVAEITDDARFEAEASNRMVRFRRIADVQVCGRTDLLYRAIENVARNAIKYTREGTTVEISMRTEAEPSYVCISVTDNGPGIPQEDIKRVFEPFYRGRSGADPKGFGLGLAIAHAAITAHGGRIQAMNSPSGGLRVEISLPRQ